MKKRILSIVLAICLVLSCVPITVFAANADTTDLQNLLNGGKTVTLSKDYNIDATLTVSNTVTLDLNGHVIKMTNNNGLITVNSGGALTLKDSNNTATHTDKSLPVGGVLTGGNSEKYGGVQVKSGATFNMNGGTIYNCSQSDVSKGGGGVCSFGNFTINGGTIENCTAGRYGGGIYIDSGSFTMNGGSIEKCSSGYGGGGILAASGSFTMNGGTIENCSAYYGEAVMTLRGMPVVANGGIIKGTFHLAPSATITTDITKGYTKFYGEIQNHGTINSGVFYGGIQNISSGRIRNTYHTVSFDLNGGSGSAPTQYFVDIDTVPALKPANPTREGYQFRGWLNGDNGYAFGNSVTNSVNLTAKWALSSVSTEAELLQAVSEGSSEIKLVDDIKLTSMLDLTDKVITLDLNGHVLSAQTPLTDFIYLYASKSAPYYNALLILIDSNPTATHTDSTLPKGGVVSCVISLNVEDGCTYSSNLSANGGTVTGRVGLNHDNTYINYTSDDAPPTAFTSSNNSIHGRILGGIYYNTLRESLINGNTVTFMDGDSTYAKEVVTNKAAYAPVEPTKDGYVFAGWYNGSTKYDFPKTITSDITLTAKWVEAVTSESTLINAINEGLTTIKLMADINLSSTLDLTDKNITLDLNGYVLTGNIQLADTSASPDSILTLIDSRPTATHSDKSLPAGGVVKGNITLTRGNGSASHLYANGGTVTGQTSLPSYVGGIFCTSDTPTAFKAYVGNYGEIHGGIFYAGINEGCIKENTVTFMNGDSRYALEVVASGNKVVAPIAPPVKEGYNSFDGWYNGDTKYTFGSTISESITLTAKFSNPKTYNISYNLGGGTATNATSYTVESDAITLNNPTKTGYTFTGWSGTGLTGENNMAVTIAKGNTGNRTYTAHFSQNSYTVNFDTNGGSSISDKKGVKWTDTVLNGITPPTKDGYEFTGWKCGDKTVNANTKYSDLAANDTVTSVTLVAQWRDSEKPTISGIENNKTYCDAVEFEVSDNDGIASVKAGNTTLTPGTNGKYTLAKGIGTVTVVATDNAGNTADVTVTVNNGHTAGTDDGDCETPVYCIYHPDTVVIEAKTHNMSEWIEDGLGHYCYCQNDGCSYACFEASHSGTDDGDCTTAVICICGHVITPANADHTYSEWQSNGNGTHTRNCTVAGCNGYEDGDCTGGQATYFNKAVCGTCHTEYGVLLTDTTAPTGEITVGTNKWNSFLNTITFGLFFKNTQSVTITATDDSYTHTGYTDDKAVKVEYYLYSGDAALTKADLANKEFTEYNSAFNINPDNKYVVYARLTDHAGNVTYISSNGVVLDSTAPVISGVENGKVYCEAQTVTVTEEYIESVKVNGTVVTLDANNQFTLNPAEGTQTIVVTDKAGNVSAEMIVTVNNGHTYGEWQSNGNGTHTHHCTVDGCNGYEDGDCDGGEANYFNKAVCDTCHTEYGALLTDTTAPTGEITVGTNKWNTFLNTITFGLFFKNTQRVTITATDDSYTHTGYTDDKAVKVEYYLYSGDTALTKADLAGKEFTEYGSAFNINPDNKYVVYVRLTDHAGNVTYISSNGIVLDATAPAITGVTDGAVYYTTQKAVVTDDNLKSVTLNGTEVDGTTVTLDGNTDEVYTIVATDKSDNSTTVTVTMKSISSLAESIDDVNGENVKSSNKEAIDAVKESVGEVDISNATDSEKEALNDINNRCDELLDIIDKAQKATQTENIKNAEEINPDNVTENDREALENAKADLEKALEDNGENYTDEEMANIELDLERVNESLKVLDNVKSVEDLIAELPDSVEPDDLETVQSILDANDAYNALTDYEKSLVSEDVKEKLYTLTAGISAYMVYEGNGGIWTIGQDGALTFTANGAYSKFTGIKVDGKDVDQSNYTAQSGSTIINLNADYLNALSVGTHTLTVLYTDGEAEAEFEVKKAPKDTEDTKETTKPNSNTSKKSPQTGNDSETALLLAFLLSCGGVIVVTGAYGKRKKHSAK